MQILQEQKQDAEIEKIQAETEGQKIENSQGDTRKENIEADTAQKRETKRKIEREQEVLSAQIEAIRANTALTEQQRATEEKRTLKEGLLTLGKAFAKLGIGGSGVGAEIDIIIDSEKYYKMLEGGKTIKEITDELIKDLEKDERERNNAEYERNKFERHSLGLS